MPPFKQFLWQLVTVVGVLLLASSAAAVVPAAAKVAAAPPSMRAPSATCIIKILGNGPDADGEVKSASIACSGSGLSMAINATSLGQFKQQFKGVTWDPGSCEELGCLVTFCGASNVAIVNSSISSVSATGTQGTLCFSGSSRALISDSTFSDNAAENGTLHIRDTAVVLVRDSVLSGAVGDRGGASQVSGDAVLTTINSSWTGNYARYGAAINVRDAATLWAIGGNTFDANTVEDAEFNYGPAGAVVYCRAEGKVYLHNSNVLSNNLALGYDSAGAAVYVQDDCLLDVKGGNAFINNTSSGDNAAGGAICGADAAVISISNATFFNNSAQGENPGGGALLLRDECDAHIFGSVNFTRNMALGDVSQGGAIYVSNDARLVVEDDILFANNSADGVNCQGGAINTRQLAATTIRRGVTFKGNSASYGGGVAAIGNMQFNLSDAVIYGHSVLGHGGALYLEGSFTASVVNTTITNNRAGQGGGIMATASTSNADSNFTLTISGNTHISNNTASTGGGLALVAGHTTLGPGVVVADNRASQGGGISISQGPSSAECTFSPAASVTNNTAVVAGGGIYLDSASVHINEAVARRIAQGNSAVFGADLSMVSECLPGEVRAGAWCQACGANLYSLNPRNASCDICPSNAVCSGGTQVNPRAGYWHSSNWSTQIHRCPNPGACTHPGVQQQQLSVDGSITLAKAGPQAALGGPGSAAAGGMSSSRALLAVTETPQHDQTVEQRLSPGFRARRQLFAAPPAAPAAEQAAAAAVPGAAAGALSLSAGLPSAAPPGGNMDWQCAEGYKGNLCGSCADNHGLRGPFQCARCIPSKAAIVLYVVSFLVLTVIIWAISHVTWMDNQDNNPELRVSDILKVLILYVQCMVILTNTPVDWPNSIAGVFAGLTWLFSAGNSQLLSVDCLVAGMQPSLPPAVVRQLVYLLAPVAMFLAVVLLQCGVRGVHWLWRRYRRPRLAIPVLSHVLERVPVTAIVTLIFFYPSLIRVALSMFACYPIDTKGGLYPQYAVANARRGYWQFDMQQACWSGWHRDWALGLGLPFTLMFCVGVPAGIVVLLWRKRAVHDDLDFRKYCGVLYRLYRKRCYGWEAVVTFQLVLLVLVSVFGPNIGVWHEMLLLNFLFGVFLVLLLMFRPYKFQRLHNIALMAMGCLNFTAYAALSFLTAMGAEAERVYKEVVGAFVLVMNAAFLLWVAYCVLLLATQLIQRVKSLRRLRKAPSKGPKESRDGFPTDAPVGNRAASPAGVVAGAAAAQAVGAAAAKAGKSNAGHALVKYPSPTALKPVV